MSNVSAANSLESPCTLDGCVSLLFTLLRCLCGLVRRAHGPFQSHPEGIVDIWCSLFNWWFSPAHPARRMPPTGEQAHRRLAHRCRLLLVYLRVETLSMATSPFASDGARVQSAYRTVSKVKNGSELTVLASHIANLWRLLPSSKLSCRRSGPWSSNTSMSETLGASLADIEGVDEDIDDG